MPSLDLPTHCGSTVDVSMIVGGHVTLPTSFMIKEQVAGHDSMTAPSYSFLVENKAKGKKILFDLGLPKAWKKKLPPRVKVVKTIEDSNGVINVPKDVADQLREGGISLESIDAIVWSHHHFDHIGDPSGFPSSTALIVGPGFKSDKTTFPGYPRNPDARTDDDAFQGREVIELDFTEAAMNIGGFPAIDYFGDGSFFLLHSKGHTHDHMCGLTRTSGNEFLFLGGDVAHHAGEFRPTSQVPLPDKIHPSPLDGDHLSPQHPPLSACPGSAIEKAHPRKGTSPEEYRTTPFYEASTGMKPFPEDAEVAVERVQDFDASAEVLVIIAHDADMESILPIFSKKLNSWDSVGYKSLDRWKFLKDFLKGKNKLRA
ncbi:hypothetical protein BDW74DRAFT_165687 [Aspergillus multicolor]|uniref:MBL fold metallo-hydrolase n=1 Tax=Aspergillus multicolor TaxID=41759 RepID=UPI003CCDDE31